jgi:23S rRNA (uracil1939-C5)-methyltransferase
MAQTNPKIGLKPEQELEITALSYGPYGIGRVDGKAVMVPHTAPGDRVRARLVDSKPHYDVGELLRVVDPSPHRQAPPCPYVGRCGGCSWQHLLYAAQLHAKQRSVTDALGRIGKLADFGVRPIIPAAGEYQYRRRIRLQVDQGKRLGFYGAASHDLIEVESCHIAASPLNLAIEPLRRWILELHSVIDYLELVKGDAPDELVAVIQSAAPLAAIDESACEDLVRSQIVHGAIAKSRTGHAVWGNPWITVVVEDDLALKLDADVFTQINAEGNRQMLRQLLDLGGFHERDRILELYSGAGNFTLPLARRVERITAVEGHRPAVANGKLNAQDLHIENIDWIVADAQRALKQLRRQPGKFSKILLDPPRAGAKGLAADLASLNAETIAYISCNPATLARDLAALTKQGYKLGVVQPIDFFPHTFHVETLALLTR